MRISSGKVAENSRFCRVFGSSARMRRMSWMKPMSSMRSAFVQHQDLDLAQVDGLLLDVVEQAAGRGDEHVDAAAQRVDLRLDADAAETRVLFSGSMLP